MSEYEINYKFTLKNSSSSSVHFNPYEIGLTKKVDWFAELWNNPLSGHSRARMLIKQIAEHSESGQSFLRSLRYAIGRKRRLTRDVKMINTLDALSGAITGFVGR